MGTHPIFESDFDCLQKPDKKTSSPWAVCTHQERVSHPLLSHTEDLSHHGKSNLLKKSRTSSTSSPRRVTSHHSSVSTSEIPTVLVISLLDWIQDPPCSQVHGSCPRTSRRSLLHDQACCWHEKAFGKKPKGQGRQIPFDSYRIQNPPSLPILPC